MAAVRAIVVIALSAIFLWLAGPPMFAHPPTGYTGAHLRLTGAVIQPHVVDVDTGSPAYRAGLRSGDIVSCLSKRDAMLLLGVVGRRAASIPGTPISLCVERGGALRRIQIVASPRPPEPSVYGNDAIAAIRLVIYAVFLLCGIALLMGRPGLMTWLFFGFCLASLPNTSLILNMTTHSPALYAADATVAVTVGSSGIGFLTLFALLVPDDRLPADWRSRAFYAVLAISAVYVTFIAFSWMQTSHFVSFAFAGRVEEVLTALAVIVVAARLAVMQRGERARFGWAAFAIVWGVVTNVLRNVAVLPQPWGTVPAMLSIVMPIALMYAILKRHVIDVRFVISRTVVYATATTMVVVLIGVLDWATSTFLHEARVAMAIDAAVTIGMGLVLHRTYRWLEYAVDYFLFRRKHNAEAYLRRLARTLYFAEEEETVDRALVHDPYEKFDLTGVALFRVSTAGYSAVRCEGWNVVDVPSFSRDHDVVRFLLAERTRLFVGDLRAYVAASFRERGGMPAVAIPIFQGNRLTAFVLYAIHRDGTQLDPDEIETLEHLCEAAAQAYTGLELARYQVSAPRQFAVEST